MTPEWRAAHYKLGRTCDECATPIKDSNKYPFCGRHSYKGQNPLKNKIAYVVINARHRAKIAGLPCDLTEANVPQVPNACECCGVEFDDSRLRRPTLDRVIPALGYVAANVAWLCWQCNRMKDNATLADLKNLVAYVERRAA